MALEIENDLGKIEISTDVIANIWVVLSSSHTALSAWLLKSSA